ncbi:S1 family peptidase [Nocardioides immobilis]|nr:serine protease [Nocardioides immobilis]
MVVVNPADGSMRVIGSAFLTGQGRHAVTAKHVIDAVPSGWELHAGLAGPDVDRADVQVHASFIYIPCDLLDEDARSDLALLELRMPPDATSVALTVTVAPVNGGSTEELDEGRTGPFKIAKGRLADGTEVATSGFPLAAPALVTTAGTLASKFAPLDPADPDAGMRHLCDLTATGGNSGGPVYRVSDGALVGVLVAGKLSPLAGGVGAQSVGLTLVTPSQDVVELLVRNGIEPDRYKALPPQPKKAHPRKKR